MFEFIEDYYNRTGKPVAIGNLLSDCQLIRGEETADPAAWYDWVKAVNKVLCEEAG
jgi:hypothetical protein